MYWSYVLFNLRSVGRQNSRGLLTRCPPLWFKKNCFWSLPICFSIHFSPRRMTYRECPTQLFPLSSFLINSALPLFSSGLYHLSSYSSRIFKIHKIRRQHQISKALQGPPFQSIRHNAQKKASHRLSFLLKVSLAWADETRAWVNLSPSS